MNNIEKYNQLRKQFNVPPSKHMGFRYPLCSPSSAYFSGDSYNKKRIHHWYMTVKLRSIKYQIVRYMSQCHIMSLITNLLMFSDIPAVTRQHHGCPGFNLQPELCKMIYIITKNLHNYVSISSCVIRVICKLTYPLSRAVVVQRIQFLLWCPLPVNK